MALAITERQATNFCESFSPEPNSGCWLWEKATNGTGYGVFRIGSLTDGTRKQVTAHRLSYELHKGAVPEDLYICHKCDVKLCVNPDHLYAGTHAENTRDAVERGRIRGRSNYGETNPNAKLSDKDVIAIRSSNRPNAALAEQYGVHKNYISGIKTRLNQRSAALT